MLQDDDYTLLNEFGFVLFFNKMFSTECFHRNQQPTIDAETFRDDNNGEDDNLLRFSLCVCVDV